MNNETTAVAEPKRIQRAKRRIDIRISKRAMRALNQHVATLESATASEVEKREAATAITNFEKVIEQRKIALANRQARAMRATELQEENSVLRAEIDRLRRDLDRAERLAEKQLQALQGK